VKGGTNFEIFVDEINERIESFNLNISRQSGRVEERRMRKRKLTILKYCTFFLLKTEKDMYTNYK